MALLENILIAAASIGVTDIHLIDGEPPVFRISRTCISLPEKLGQECSRGWGDLKRELLNLRDDDNDSDAIYSEKWEESDAHIFSGMWKNYRIRMTFYRTMQREAVALRLLHLKLPAPSELGFHLDFLDALQKDLEPGLILISGGPCAGKTTTMHSLINWMSSNYPFHIRTLEAPIEFVHDSKQSFITQQTIGEGKDCETYNLGVEDALIQDVNVIAFGEICNLVTLKAALKAANLNFLVLATVHGNSPAYTLSRCIEEFPEHDREIAAISLSRCIKMVIHQELLFARNVNPSFSDYKITLGSKLEYQAIHFTEENQMRSLITNKKFFELDEKFKFPSRGIYQTKKLI